MSSLKYLSLSFLLLLITSCGKQEYTHLIENELSEQVIMEAFTGTPSSDYYKEATLVISENETIVLAVIDRNKDNVDRDGIDFASGLSQFFDFRVDSLRFIFQNQSSISFGSFRSPSIPMNPLLDVDIDKSMTDKNEYQALYRISQTLKEAAN